MSSFNNEIWRPVASRACIVTVCPVEYGFGGAKKKTRGPAVEASANLGCA